MPRRSSAVYKMDLERGGLSRLEFRNDLPEGKNPRRDSIGFRDAEGKLYAAVPEGEKGWRVKVSQEVKGAWTWVTENRPQITTGVKAAAAGLAFGSAAMQAAGGSESVKTALATASTVLTTATQIPDVAHYAHSA